MHARRTAPQHLKPVEPCLDPPPDPGPGGVDRVEPEHTWPVTTPDPPRLEPPEE